MSCGFGNSIIYEYDEESESLVVRRKNRENQEKEICLVAKTQVNCEKIGETEFEISKDKFIRRNNLDIPNMVKNSTPLSQKVGLTTEGIVAFKNTIKIKQFYLYEFNILHRRTPII